MMHSEAILPEHVRGLAHRMLDRSPVSGGAIAVRAVEARAEYAFGLRGPGGAPVEAGDRFEIGSISKTVAALAAARLEVEGVWGLDTPVRELLPWLELPLGAGEPSLRHLLSHTAGWAAGNSASPGEIAQALTLPQSRAVAAPGEYFHYSNVGFVVLGLAMAATTGRGFAEAVRELVLEPLGLPGAMANITGAERAALCPGTVPLRDDAPWAAGDPLAAQTWVEPAGADGNIGASAAELLRFASALASPGSVELAPWLPEAVARIATPAAPGGEGVLGLGRRLAVGEDRYGLGVNVEPTSEGALLTHGGGMIGYGAFMIAHPDRGIAVSVVLSTPGEWPHAELLAREAHAAALEAVAAGASGAGSAESVDLEILLGSEDPLAEILPVRAPLLPGTGPLAALTGHYRSYTPWCPHFEVGVAVEEGGAERLVLRAYSGVEAPTEDVPLVPLVASDGAAGSDAEAPDLAFRVGADPRLPERIRFGDLIDGRAQTFDLDGCRYARVADR